MNICRTSLNCDGCSYWSLIRCDFLVDQCVYINNIIFTFVVSDRVQLSTSNFHENPKCTLYERVLQYFPGDYVDVHVPCQKDNAITSPVCANFLKLNLYKVQM